VKIGDGAKVGANATVVADVPDHATAVGLWCRTKGDAGRPSEPRSGPVTDGRVDADKAHRGHGTRRASGLGTRLGNGYCTKPAALDCPPSSDCTSCGFFANGLQPT
jgi:hypothetical protein